MRQIPFKKTLIGISLLGLSVFAFSDRFSHLELFAKTLNLIKTNYYKPVKTKPLIEGAIRGLLREVDPHSQFLLPEDLNKLKDEASGKLFGLGMETERKEDFLMVISIIKNSPAEKAGFQPGDRIVQIEDKNLKNFTGSEFHYLFKKRDQKKYKIKVLREEIKKPLVLYVKPSSIQLQSVDFKEIEKNLFYLRIHSFSENTLFEINKALKNKKIKGLILDLRSNPGGIFEQSVKIADLFLNQGLIVRYKLRTEKKAKEFFAHYSDSLPDFPLVVLINEYSASGSEIVAGALKDHKRATLVGRKTFGKGSIQNVFYLNKDHALKLTVGEYQTPSGKFIHNKGIEPNVKLKRKSIHKALSKNSVLKDVEIHQAFQILKAKL